VAFLDVARKLEDAYSASYPASVLGALDPHINSLSPATGSAAAGPILVTVNGTRFVAGAVIEINQVAVPTTFVSATQLTTSYDPTVAGTVTFTVRQDPHESNSVPFVVGALQEDTQQGDVPEPEPEPAPEPEPTPTPKMGGGVGNGTRKRTPKNGN